MWIKDMMAEYLSDFEKLENRVNDIDGWRVGAVHSINTKIIPCIARLQIGMEGITKRIDGMNKYLDKNRGAFNGNGDYLNINTLALERNNHQEEEMKTEPSQSRKQYGLKVGSIQKKDQENTRSSLKENSRNCSFRKENYEQVQSDKSMDNGYTQRTALKSDSNPFSPTIGGGWNMWS